MPGPLDYLKKAYSFATTPLVSKEAIEPAQEALDAPALDRSPMEARLRGFGAGALEGLRGFTSPLSIAALAGGIPELGAAKAAPGIVRGAEAMAPAAEFVAPGAEAAFNAARPALRSAMDPVEAAYSRILSRGGRLAADETGAISPETAILTGGAMAGLGYAGKKLYDSFAEKKDELEKKVNPLRKYSDLVSPYGQK